VCRFDPAVAARRIQTRQDAIAVDIGGDKIRGASYTLDAGTLARGDEHALQAKGGAGYLAFLEGLAADAVSRNLRVGISSATKMQGSVITRTVNLPVFLAEMTERYGADYSRLFPRRSFAANDTIAGVIGASTHLALQGTPTEHIAFVICASGMGASVIANGIATHVEVGHVPLVDTLNPLGQTTPCGVEGREYVCVERVTAARAGIEDIYRQHTGRSLDGVSLGRMYKADDPLATVLYEISALALAHAIAGLATRFGFPARGGGVVVLHGGNFEVARYRESVLRNLDALPGPRCRVVFARDLSTNVCLDGAAIAAIVDPARVLAT
jgi:predicted NBD/HSP70 family sugar kinase